MKINERYLYDPKYFDMLVSSSGQLSGIDRRDRIIEIGLKNIWLAARCTNTSIYRDPIVIDWIINRCRVLYTKFNDLQALVALLEIQEYEIVAIILDLPIMTKAVSRPIKRLLLNNNTSISEAFSVFSEYIPKELSVKLFNRLLELGYVLDVVAYNALISKSESEEEANRITEQMISTGLEATSITYLQLIRKLKSPEQILNTFYKFRSVANFELEIKKVNEVYEKVISFSDDMKTIQSVYDDYLSRIPTPDYFSIDVYSYYLSKAILNAKTFDEASAMYYDYYNKYIVNYISKKKSGLTRGGIIKVANAYLVSSTKHDIDFHILKKVLEDILIFLSDKKYSHLGDRELNVSIRSFYRLKYSMQQKIELMELIENSNCNVYPTSYNGFLYDIKTEEEFEYFSNRCDIMTIKPQVITNIINRIPLPLSLLLFRYLKEKGYPLNLYIYNTVIKKQPFNECIKIIKSMKDDYLTPDIQTIQPLLRKWVSIDQFIATIRMAKLYTIDPDQKAIDAILYRVKELSINKEFLECFYTRSRYDENSWDSVISKVCNVILTGCQAR